MKVKANRDTQGNVIGIEVVTNVVRVCSVCGKKFNTVMHGWHDLDGDLKNISHDALYCAGCYGSFDSDSDGV